MEVTADARTRVEIPCRTSATRPAATAAAHPRGAALTTEAVSLLAGFA